MLAKSNLFLIGPMGSGKSAVGRQLARLLGLPFYDSDAEIERRTGVDIPFIFEKEGEAGFRQREHETLEILTVMRQIVLATGGGAVLLPENRRMLAERGRVVYLKTSIAQQVERVRALRAKRDAASWKAALAGVEDAARSGANLMPRILAAVEANATVGEISDAMRRVFGEYREAVVI